MLINSIAIAVLWAAIPFTHLFDLGYTFFSFEVWTISATFFAVGLVLAIGFIQFGLLFVLSAASIFFLVCVYFLNTATLSPVLLAALFGSIFLIQMRFGNEALLTASIFAAVFSLSNIFVPKAESFALPATTVAQQGTPQNALVHIILDEQSSLDAFGNRLPQDHPAKSIYDDYASRGYKVFRNARSAHPFTNRSLPDLVSMGEQTDNLIPFDRHDDHNYSVKHNPQFEQLVGYGYRVRVLQSGYLDFCADVREVACRTYPTNDMSVFQSDVVPLADRYQAAFRAIQRDYNNPLSGRYVWVFRVFSNYFYRPEVRFRYPTWPLQSLEALDFFERDLTDIQQGDVYFAHFLFPHFPYQLDSDCSLKRLINWTYPLRHSRRQNIEEMEAGYWDQAACAHSRVLRLLDAVEDKPYVSVIIHGDHGARLYQDADGENETDSLHTFLVARHPLSAQSEHLDQVSLTGVFAQEFRAFVRNKEFVFSSQ